MNHGHRAMPSDLRVAESFPVIKPSAKALTENGSSAEPHKPPKPPNLRTLNDEQKILLHQHLTNT